MIGLKRYLATVLLIALLPGVASADPSADQPNWSLPAKLDDTNTTVTFEVDSTWHTIHGKTSGLSGELHLADPTQPDSIRGTITIPVAKFDTDNSSRDSRLREVMSETKYSRVEFVLESFAGGCPQEISASGCKTSAEGTLKIADHSETVKIDLTVTRANNSTYVEGTSKLSWRAFPIEDPSIMIAKLYDDVTVKFKLALPSQQKEVK
jgi:polyisoprenoid-binding protein YceI